jgi:hypothetical protein
MSNPLEDYLAALEARDAREKAHETYVNACKRLLHARHGAALRCVEAGSGAHDTQIQSSPMAQQAWRTQQPLPTTLYLPARRQGV